VVVVHLAPRAVFAASAGEDDGVSSNLQTAKDILDVVVQGCTTSKSLGVPSDELVQTLMNT
jgi:hypothetical protein